MIGRMPSRFIVGALTLVLMAAPSIPAQESNIDRSGRGSAPSLDQLKVGLGHMNAGEFDETLESIIGN